MNEYNEESRFWLHFLEGEKEMKSGCGETVPQAGRERDNLIKYLFPPMLKETTDKTYVKGWKNNGEMVGRVYKSH